MLFTRKVFFWCEQIAHLSFHLFLSPVGDRFIIFKHILVNIANTMVTRYNGGIELFLDWNARFIRANLYQTVPKKESNKSHDIIQRPLAWKNV